MGRDVWAGADSGAPVGSDPRVNQVACAFRLEHQTSVRLVVVVVI